MKTLSALRQNFKHLSSQEPRLYRAPGRVNLIGEHTDYNDGFVMPAAINFATYLAAAPRDDQRLRIHSEIFGSREFSLATQTPHQAASHHWSDYVVGVAVSLAQAGYAIGGADLLIASEIPVGAGLSSSAAVEVVTALALSDLAGIALDRTEIAQLCQQAENDYVGMRCGIMDQFIACYGEAGQVLKLDCRSLAYQLLPMASEVCLVVCNTMVKHKLAGGEYNRRRAECEAGVAYLAEHLPAIKALRDVTLSQLETCGAGLDETIWRRCHHVVSENQRVLDAAAALEAGDLTAFGQLMNDSHHSLRNDYEVSCYELDLMSDIARELSGVYGARMTGGGFGGCTINLVRAENVDEFKVQITDRYQELTGIVPEIYVCTPSDGAGRIA